MKCSSGSKEIVDIVKHKIIDIKIVTILVCISLLCFYFFIFRHALLNCEKHMGQNVALH